MTHVRVLLSLVFLALIGGCEDNPSDVIDTTGAAPIVRAVSVSPLAFNLDALPHSGSTYSLSVVITATVGDPQGPADIAGVLWSVTPPGAGAPLSSGSLAPTTGVPGATEQEYASVVRFDVTRSQTGRYRLELKAVDKSGLAGTISMTWLTVGVNNTPPVLTLPGAREVARAGTDSVRFLVTVSARDSNGLADIADVTVRALNSRDSSSVVMTDDGSRARGDAIAGDGIYTAFAWVMPRTSLDQVVFEYRARDRAGASSPVLLRSVNNQPPRFVSLTVPAVIQRPPGGTSLVSFFARVDDPNGLTDIDSVYFRNLSSTAPTNILMYDDGDITQHGDSTAADGIYSRILSIDAATTPGVKEFRFSAVDRGGARADSTRLITIN